MKLTLDHGLLVLVFLALGALIVVHIKPSAPVAQIGPEAPLGEPDPSPEAAPLATSYNVPNSAYNFGPPWVNQIVPAATMGIAGAANAVGNMLGCKSCGSGR